MMRATNRLAAATHDRAATRANSMPARTTWHVVAACVAAVAVAMPVRATALLLVGNDASGQRWSDVINGAWTLKAALLIHAVLLVIVPRLRLPAHTRGLAPNAVPSAPVRLSRAEWGWLAVLCAVALAVRLPSLGRGLWIDEIEMYVTHASQPLAQIVSTFESQNQHLLYSFLAKLVLLVAPDPAWALRFPAALLGVLSLAAVVWFGLQVTERRQAWLTAALLAVSYHHVWFSQNARGYTGLLLFTIVGTGCFLRLLAAPGHDTKRWVMLYAISMALGHLVHVTAAFVTLGHALVWLGLVVSRRRELRGGGWVPPFVALTLAGTLSALLYALVLPQFLETLLAPTDGGSAGMWKSPSWLIAETLRVLATGIPGGLVTVAVALGVVGVGVTSYARQSRPVATIMLLPLVCTAAALVATAHNLWPRFFFFGAAFVVLVAIRGGFVVCRAIVPRFGTPLATAGAALVVVASAMTVPRAWGPKQDFDAARAYVEASRTPDDAIAGVDMTGLVYTRYYNRPWADLTSLDQLTALESAHPRTWVLLTFPSRLEVIQPALWQHLTRSYRTAATFPGTVGGGAIVVMVTR